MEKALGCGADALILDLEDPVAAAAKPAARQAVAGFLRCAPPQDSAVVAYARRVVAAFAAAPDAGVLALDGPLFGISPGLSSVREMI